MRIAWARVGEHLAATAAWLAPLAVYTLTLLPGTGYSGDTAKFQYLGKVLGTAHPTGYPGYILLNGLFTWLMPFGSQAWQANFMSAVTAAATCAVLYRTLRLLRIRTLVALSAATTFGFTYLFWSQAVVAEVYALNALFTAVVIHLLVKWDLLRERRLLLAAALVYAISFGNHLSMISLLPGIAAFVWIVDRGLYRDLRLIRTVALFALLGIAQYGYLFWRSLDPGSVAIEADVHDLRSLAACVSGSPFRAFMFNHGAVEVLKSDLPNLLRILAEQYYLLLIPILWGLKTLRPGRLWWLLAPAFCLQMFLNANYSIPDIEFYLIPCALILVLPLGAGLESAAAFTSRRLPRGFVVWTMLLPAALLWLNWSEADQSHNTEDAAEALAFIQEMGPGSIVVPPDYDTTCYLLYYLYGEEMVDQDIHLMVWVQPKEMAAYLKGKSDLTSKDGKLTIEKGRDIFVMDEKRAHMLRLAGCWTHQLRSGLFLITDGDMPSEYRLDRHKFVSRISPTRGHTTAAGIRRNR